MQRRKYKNNTRWAETKTSKKKHENRQQRIRDTTTYCQEETKTDRKRRGIIRNTNTNYKANETRKQITRKKRALLERNSPRRKKRTNKKEIRKEKEEELRTEEET